jgi:DNA-binding MurR/RpiR family transcriptional regulator
MDTHQRSGVVTDGRRWLQMMVEGRHLSPAQRKVARFLVEHPEQGAFLSAEELGERSGVSQPSVTRFAVALGFANFTDLREELRGQMRGNGPAGGSTGSDGDARFAQSVDVDTVNLRDLASSPWAGERLQRVGELLAASHPLLVVGHRVSRPFADLFGHFASIVHPDVRVVPPGSEGEDAVTVGARAGATWLLAFGLPRYPKELLRTIRVARQLGLRVALLTDSPLCPLAHEVDDLLAAPVNTEMTFDSAVAPLALTMGLLQVVTDSLGDRAQARLDEFDQLADERDQFIT